MDYFRVALVLKPHGVKGDMKIHPLSDDASRFRRLRDAYIEHDGKYEAITVDGCRGNDDTTILHIKGVETPEAVEKLRGCYICVDREHSVALPKDCYFISDLIGCTVSSENGEALGSIIDVLETNANDVYVIQGKRRLLVPVLKKLIVSVDIKSKRIVLDHAVLAEVGLFED